MLFYLTTLDLVRFLMEDPPTKNDDEQDRDYLITREAWNNSDYLCRHYVMNCLSDSLYDLYSMKKSAKELWSPCTRNIKTEDTGAKKFIVDYFLDFKIVDSKTVMSQIILHEIQAERMVLSEDFQVATIIEKLPPGWKDFKNYLKHK